MLYTTYLKIFYNVFKSINSSNKICKKKLGQKTIVAEACFEINELFGPGVLALVSVSGFQTFNAVFILVAHGVEFKYCILSLFVIYDLIIIVHYASKVTNEVINL